MVKMFRKIRRIHFIGIGGSGMCGIAELLINLGYPVSGSDLMETSTTQRLKMLGGTVFKGHDPSHVEGAEVVVISSAVSEDNPEVCKAREMMIPVIRRAEMLAELMRLKYGIAVAGAHGKTTTTSFIASMLGSGGFDPTAVIGGKVNSLESNAKLGQGEFLVAEADESDGSFLRLTPTIAVVTNIDKEHLDYYKNMEALKDAFLEFINKVPFYGVAIICLDEPYLQSLIPGIRTRYLTYGLTAQSDFTACDITREKWKSSFRVTCKGKSLGMFTLNMPGTHNIYNALAAIAVCVEMEMDEDDIRKGLEHFSGIERRLQLKGVVNDITIVDDYGHHPTEITATLETLKHEGHRLIVVFQPHRYSRTMDHMDNFARSFNDADCLLMLDIYAAGEKPVEGVSGEVLAGKIKESGHHDVCYFSDRKKLLDEVIRVAEPGDVVLTLGAGDVCKLGDDILKMLRH